MDDVINLDKISKSLGNREILRNVSFTVKKGDIFGYLGPNGAGKTTTIRIMLGLMQAGSGQIRILGQDVQQDLVRRKLGFVLEADGLYDNLSAFHNLLYYSRIYEIPDPAPAIDTALRMVGLSDRAKDKVGAYSKGMRQRLALARAIIHDPELLILDEPTAGVDPTGQIEIREIMLNMVRSRSKTILLSSHNLDEVQRICNRVALIHKGEIKLYGELEKLQREMSPGEVVIETSESVNPMILDELQRVFEIQVRSQTDHLLTLSLGQGIGISGIVTLMASRGAKIEQVRKQEASLEEIYTTILKETEAK